MLLPGITKPSDRTKAAFRPTIVNVSVFLYRVKEDGTVYVYISS